jgi:predicted DCC family thiol-disulfide oxidoreductase YuxK
MANKSSLKTQYSNNPILLFDGVCNLCNVAVDFVIKHEKEPNIHFTSIQSTFGQKILFDFNIVSTKLNTLYVFDDNKLLSKSTAVLFLAKQLKNPWLILSYFSVFPKAFLDFFYDIIAQNRYKLFGKKEFCSIPTLADKARFLG